MKGAVTCQTLHYPTNQLAKSTAHATFVGTRVYQQLPLYYYTILNIGNYFPCKI